jgi:class 3 adenylate cyclase
MSDPIATRLEVVEKARAWPAGLVGQLEALLRGPDERLIRVNPIGFATAAGATPDDGIALFLQAAHAGLFTMDWHMLCPMCGTSVESFETLRRVHRHFACPLCLIDGQANLDDHIQVGFTVAPSVRRLPIHDPESLSARAAFLARMTPEAKMGQYVLSDLILRAALDESWIEPGQTARFSVEVKQGLLGMGEFQGHTAIRAKIRDGGAVKIDLRVTNDGAIQSTMEVRPGRVEVAVHNERNARFAIYVGNYPDMSLDDRHPVQFDPYLTGSRLLTNQTFRKLFRSETVQAEDGIAVRDVTILFTDLKGSTALYERIGDIEAFAIVHAHFDRLASVVQTHGGAVVKTIGDAVMAVFADPVRAAHAALDMLAQIEDFNRERGRHDVVLKIGLHRGPSIAVTLNENLDYFGQTVNVAARVQALADADEIFVTDDVFGEPGVAGVLAGAQSQEAQLRGIQRPVRVHRVRRG